MTVTDIKKEDRDYMADIGFRSDIRSRENSVMITGAALTSSRVYFSAEPIDESEIAREVINLAEEKPTTMANADKDEYLILWPEGDSKRIKVVEDILHMGFPRNN